MRRRRVPLAAVLLGGLVAAPAAEAATALSVGRTCYAEGDTISLNGTGFSPNGAVRLTLERAGRPPLADTSEPRADSNGRVSGGYGVGAETRWFSGSETRFDMTARMVDQARVQAGTPAESPDATATTTFIFSRWNIGFAAPGRRIRPTRPLGLQVVGYTNAIGRNAYLHYVKGGRRVRTRRLGVLRGPCGDRTVRLRRAFGFRPSRGTWSLRVNTSRTRARTADTLSLPNVRVR